MLHCRCCLAHLMLTGFDSCLLHHSGLPFQRRDGLTSFFFLSSCSNQIWSKHRRSRRQRACSSTRSCSGTKYYLYYLRSLWSLRITSWWLSKDMWWSVLPFVDMVVITVIVDNKKWLKKTKNGPKVKKPISRLRLLCGEISIAFLYIRHFFNDLIVWERKT